MLRLPSRGGRVEVAVKRTRRLLFAEMYGLVLKVLHIVARDGRRAIADEADSTSQRVGHSV